MTFKEYFGNSRRLILLIGLNIIFAIIIFAVSLVGGEPGIGKLKSLLALPADFITFLYRPWTALSYMFVQFSFLHLLFNMLWLLWFGKIFLLCSDEKRLTLTYIGGGLTGAAIFLIVCAITQGGAGSYLVGSSAAVLAVMTAAALMAPNLELNLLLLGSVRLKYVALLCIVLLFIGIGGGNAGGLSAHVGGILFGIFASSRFVRRNFNLPEMRVQPLLSAMKRLFRKKRVKKVPENLKNHSFRVFKPDPVKDEERLDELLEKVRVSGYDSLSSGEKRELNEISNRL